MKHKLVWMSVRRAKCACGEAFAADPSLSRSVAQDHLLDLYAAHVEPAK